MQRKFTSTQDLERKIEEVTRLIQNSSEQHIPNRKTKPTQYPPEITENIRERNRIRRQWQRQRQAFNTRDQLQELNRDIELRIWFFL